MASEGIVFAVIAAVAFGIWQVFHNQASTQISPTLGAIIVSLTAVVLGLLVLLALPKGDLVFNNKGILLVVLAGIFAFLLDYFILKTYASGISLSIGGPIIIGGGIAIASIAGVLFFHETITLPKVIGIILVAIGAGILATF